MTRRGGRPRPARATAPIVASALGLGGWAAVAHNSGSGWVQAVGCLLAGFVAVGLLGPAVAAARLRVEILAAPSEGTVGRAALVRVRTSGAARIEPLAPGGPIATVAAGEGLVPLVPSRRGEVRSVAVRVGSAAPFGMLWWRRRLELPLPGPLWVAPVPSAPDHALVRRGADSATVGVARARRSHAGEARGVRPYAAGDPLRAVHWPSTAHRGELMVREVERPERGVPWVEVVLSDDGDAGDAAAGRALATLLELLRHTSPVMVATTERDGPRRGPVYGPQDAARRMARAVAAR